MIYVSGVPLLANVDELLLVLQKTLESKGLHLLGRMKPSGDSIQFSCPFHGEGQERHASCGILTRDRRTTKKVIPAGTYNCLTCGSTGTVDLFVSRLFGREDGGIYGYQWLVSHFCSVEISERQKIDLDFGNAKDVRVENIIAEEELAKYRFYHPYMWERKLTEKVVNYFDVGYDKETDCLTFPVKDQQGIPRYIQRRSVSTKFFKFDEDSDKGNYVYGLYEASLNPHLPIIVCESHIDALTAWVRGYAGLATAGALVTPRQIDILAKYPARKYIVATDDDMAGHLAASKLARMNKILVRMSFNGKKDLNAMTDEDWLCHKLSLMF